MKWCKLGLLYSPSGESVNMRQYAIIPTPLYIYNDIYRIYFGSCDSKHRACIFWLDFDISKMEILHVNTNPVIQFGAYGFFDDNGILPSSIIRYNDEIRLYCIGLSIKNSILFDAAIGLAISKDNGINFDKFAGPIHDRTIEDPCFSTSPYVLYDSEKKKWRMWYVSCEYWKPINNGYRHFYNIKHRFSDDGIHWQNPTSTCIDFANKYEYAFAHPCILKENGIFKMWYSFRAQENIQNYRLGYAESNDGLLWVRKDTEMHDFNVSNSGWDSEMLCYAHIFDHKGERYMLYNGNGYGKTGFGLAVLDK